MTQHRCEMAKLRGMHVKLLSNLSGTCGPPRRPPGLDEVPPLPPHPSASVL
jgi:hypothetical protein